MNYLKLSIITINLNNKEGLKKTIDSISKQSFKSYEHIIIDGESVDGSKEVIVKYQDSNPHVTFWVSEKDSGIYNAMNKGISHASGEYLLFLNSGDYLESEVLSLVHEQLTGEDIIYGDLYFISKEGEQRLETFNHSDLSISTVLMPSFYIPHPAAFIKRNLFEKEQYDEQYKIVSDWFFFVKQIIFENRTTKHIPYAITNFIDGGVSSITENKALILEEREDVLRKMFPDKVLKGLNKLINIEQSILYDTLFQEKYSMSFQRKAKKLIKFYYKVYKLFH